MRTGSDYLTLAKIADSFDELGDHDNIKPFKFDVMSNEELQLVRVKTIPTQQGEAFVRQFVRG